MSEIENGYNPNEENHEDQSIEAKKAELRKQIETLNLTVKNIENLVNSAGRSSIYANTASEILADTIRELVEAESNLRELETEEAKSAQV